MTAMTPMNSDDKFEIRRDEQGNLEAYLVESGGERYLAGISAEAHQSQKESFVWLVSSAASFHDKQLIGADEA